MTHSTGTPILKNPPRALLSLLLISSWTLPSTAGEVEASEATPSPSLTPRLDQGPEPQAPGEESPPAGDTTKTSPSGDAAEEAHSPTAPEVEEEPKTVVFIEADEEPAEPEPAPQQVAPPSPVVAAEDGMQTRRRWYGWQNLIADGGTQLLGIGIGVATTDSGGGAGLAVGMTGYALGSPIVHFAHGHIGKGFGSLGLRLGLPAAGGFIGFGLEKASCGNNSFCGLGGLLLGIGTGALAAIALDVSLLAYEDVPDDEASRGSTLGSLALVPVVSRDRTGLWLNGTF